MTQEQLKEIKNRWATYPKKLRLWAHPDGILAAAESKEAMPLPPFEYLTSSSVKDAQGPRSVWACVRSSPEDVTALIQHITELEEKIRNTEVAVKALTDSFLEAASNMRKQWGREVADLQNQLARHRGQEETHSDVAVS